MCVRDIRSSTGAKLVARPIEVRRKVIRAVGQSAEGVGRALAHRLAQDDGRIARIALRTGH
jgi:hypothetical protein